MIKPFLILLFIAFMSCQAQRNDVFYAGNSEEKLDALLQNVDGMSLIEIATQFVGSPYKTNSLEIPGNEKLVVDFTGFDCVTLLETSIALKLSKGSKSGFQDKLKMLRYRNMQINGYLSRLHYFSEWISHNQKNGLLKDVTGRLGGIDYSPNVSFMSANADKYVKLVRPGQIDSLRLIEQDINDQDLLYLPKGKVADIGSDLKTGDIIAISTSITGLDFTHVGFVIMQEGVPYFLHASSQFEKVMLTTNSLYHYLQAHKHMTGLVILRMN